MWFVKESRFNKLQSVYNDLVHELQIKNSRIKGLCCRLEDQHSIDESDILDHMRHKYIRIDDPFERLRVVIDVAIRKARKQAVEDNIRNTKELERLFNETCAENRQLKKQVDCLKEITTNGKLLADNEKLREENNKLKQTLKVERKRFCENMQIDREEIGLEP